VVGPFPPSALTDSVHLPARLPHPSPTHHNPNPTCVAWGWIVHCLAAPAPARDPPVSLLLKTQILPHAVVRSKSFLQILLWLPDPRSSPVRSTIRRPGFRLTWTLLSLPPVYYSESSFGAGLRDVPPRPPPSLPLPSSPAADDNNNKKPTAAQPGQLPAAAIAAFCKALPAHQSGT
jgi:hypothetical protein